jgi:hypothetical protein
LFFRSQSVPKSNPSSASDSQTSVPTTSSSTSSSSSGSSSSSISIVVSSAAPSVAAPAPASASDDTLQTDLVDFGEDELLVRSSNRKGDMTKSYRARDSLLTSAHKRMTEKTESRVSLATPKVSSLARFDHFFSWFFLKQCFFSPLSFLVA